MFSLVCLSIGMSTLYLVVINRKFQTLWQRLLLHALWNSATFSFLTHFDVTCDLLPHRHMETWNTEFFFSDIIFVFVDGTKHSFKKNSLIILIIIFFNFNCANIEINPKVTTSKINE